MSNHWSELLRHRDSAALIELALREDLDPGGVMPAPPWKSDITSYPIFGDSGHWKAAGRSRAACVATGLSITEEVYARIDERVSVALKARDGQKCAAGDVLFELEGPPASLLAGERCVLNFLMRLCGIATQTNRWVELLPAGSPTRLYDTRKTLPGWRRFDKAAVLSGGAYNHRMGLYDEVMIKDNHIAAARGIARAVKAVREAKPKARVEVEVDTMEQLEQAFEARAEVVLLDNMSDQEVAQAIDRRDQRGLAGAVELEASGGITESRIAALGALGVDRISLGALTHSVMPIDIGLDVG